MLFGEPAWVTLLVAFAGFLVVAVIFSLAWAAHKADDEAEAEFHRQMEERGYPIYKAKD